MIIPCKIFKPSGKYYTDEDIEIPDNTQDFNISDEIYKYARIRNMTYFFYEKQFEVPRLIHIDD